MRFRVAIMGNLQRLGPGIITAANGSGRVDFAGRGVVAMMGLTGTEARATND